MERQYKDSGIEWIREIPKEWKTERVKSLLSERNERDCQGKTLLSVSQYFGIRPKSETDLADSHIAESYDDYKEVHKGDFVMNIMLAWNGSYAVSDYDGIVSPAYCVFKFRKDCCEKYFHYLLRTDGYPSAFKTMSRGVIDSRLRLYPEQFYTFPVIIPSVVEQQRIADYLDEKCGEIDSLISLQEQMVEKLKAYKQSVITEAVTKGLDPNSKLVPSGIDWIGEIPEGWSLAKMDYICSVITDFVASGSFESLRINVPYLDSQDYAMLVRTADLSGSAKSDKRVYISKHSYDFLKNSNLFGGEIVLPNIGASVGDVYMVPESLYSKMSLGPNSIMLKTRYYDKYYYYYFLGEPGRRSVVNMCQATAQPKFNKTQLRGLQVVFPPITIQKEIALILDEKCADIDRLIALKQQKIETLNEYKKSLIYEAATGKIDLTA